MTLFTSPLRSFAYGLSPGIPSPLLGPRASQRGARRWARRRGRSAGWHCLGCSREWPGSLEASWDTKQVGNRVDRLWYMGHKLESRWTYQVNRAFKLVLMNYSDLCGRVPSSQLGSLAACKSRPSYDTSMRGVQAKWSCVSFPDIPLRS